MEKQLSSPELRRIFSDQAPGGRTEATLTRVFALGPAPQMLPEALGASLACLEPFRSEHSARVPIELVPKTLRRQPQGSHPAQGTEPTAPSAGDAVPRKAPAGASRAMLRRVRRPLASICLGACAALYAQDAGQHEPPTRDLAAAFVERLEPVATRVDRTREARPEAEPGPGTRAEGEPAAARSIGRGKDERAAAAKSAPIPAAASAELAEYAPDFERPPLHDIRRPSWPASVGRERDIAPAAPPPGEAERVPEIDRASRGEIQRRLTLTGFDTGGVDGIFGPNTRAAIVAWQRTGGRPATGILDGEQISTLKAETEAVYRRFLQAARPEREGGPSDAGGVPSPPRPGQRGGDCISDAGKVLSGNAGSLCIAFSGAPVRTGRSALAGEAAAPRRFAAPGGEILAFEGPLIAATGGISAGSPGDRGGGRAAVGGGESRGPGEGESSGGTTSEGSASDGAGAGSSEGDAADGSGSSGGSASTGGGGSPGAGPGAGAGSGVSAGEGAGGFGGGFGGGLGVGGAIGADAGAGAGLGGGTGGEEAGGSSGGGSGGTDGR